MSSKLQGQGLSDPATVYAASSPSSVGALRASNRATTGETSTYLLTVTVDPNTTAEPTGTALPGPDTCGGPATELTLDVPVDGLVQGVNAEFDGRAYFCVEVPSGGDLAITVTELSGNLDLLVRRAGEGVSAFDRSRGGSGRMVVVESPPAGVYYIELVPALAGASSPFTIEAAVA